MGIGYRIFVVEEEGIRRVSQKTFDDLFFHKKRPFPEVRGRTIDVIAAFYEVENRKPSRVIRLDSMRLKIRPDGSLDEDQQHQICGLAANRIGRAYGEEQPQETTNVVDATKRFEDKQWQWHHPEIPASVRKRVLDALFE